MTSIVMHPVFSPTATMASLVTFIMSMLTTVASLPNGLLASAGLDPHVITYLTIISLVMAGMTGAHMSVSRSLLPSVDGTKTVEVPAPSTVTVETPAKPTA